MARRTCIDCGLRGSKCLCIDSGFLRCNECLEKKDVVSDYYWNGERPHRKCKECEKARQNKARSNPYRRAKMICQQKKSIANRLGVRFDLDADWLIEKIEAGVCEFSGIPFADSESGSYNNPFVPSIDRIKPGGDYTKDNCRVVVNILNGFMANYTDDEVLITCKAIYERYCL